MDDDGKPKSEGSPAIERQVWPWSSLRRTPMPGRSGSRRGSACKPARRIGVAGDLVHALAELGKGSARSRRRRLVRRREGGAAVLAQVVAAVEMPTCTRWRRAGWCACTGRRCRVPLARVLVVIDARDHLPGVAAVAAAKERRRLDTAPQSFLPSPGSRTRYSPGRGRPPWEKPGRLRLLEAFAGIGRQQDLHAKKALQLERTGGAPRRVDEAV